MDEKFSNLAGETIVKNNEALKNSDINFEFADVSKEMIEKFQLEMSKDNELIELATKNKEFMKTNIKDITDSKWRESVLGFVSSIKKKYGLVAFIAIPLFTSSCSSTAMLTDEGRFAETLAKCLKDKNSYACKAGAKRTYRDFVSGPIDKNRLKEMADNVYKKTYSIVMHGGYVDCSLERDAYLQRACNQAVRDARNNQKNSDRSQSWDNRMDVGERQLLERYKDKAFKIGEANPGRRCENIPASMFNNKDFFGRHKRVLIDNCRKGQAQYNKNNR